MLASDFNTKISPTWCPGCGDYSVWAALKEALAKLGWRNDEFVVVYGIGCSGNMYDFVASRAFHALHGRAIPVAAGIRLVDPKLPVVCVVGDGDAYGEGLNHLVHAARANFDITVIVHDNRVYGLTTGQVSPTAGKGSRGKSTPQGTLEEPLNPLALAITQGASFVAQGFAADVSHLTNLIVSAVNHPGFALLNVLQPCVTFNKTQTAKWFLENSYKLEEPGNPRSKMEALQLVVGTEKLPLGVLYRDKRPTYEVSLSAGLSTRPDISDLLDNFR